MMGYKQSIDLGNGYFRVPLSKNFNSIKPDYNDITEGLYGGDLPHEIKDNENIYHGQYHYNKEKNLFRQYRDGCFYPYVGKLLFCNKK